MTLLHIVLFSFPSPLSAQDDALIQQSLAEASA